MSMAEENMESSRSRVSSAFALEKPEQVPVGVCLGGSWPLLVEGYTLQSLLQDADKAAEFFYTVNDRVDADFVTVGTGATAFVLEALGASIRFSKNGAPEILPLPLHAKEDIDGLDITKAMRAPRVVWLKDVAAKVAKLNGGKRSVFVSGRAPFTLAGQIFGLENLSKALYKNREFVEHLLEFTVALSVTYYEEMLSAGDFDGIFIADPSASGDVVSRRHFEAFVVPYLTRVIERLAPHERLTLLHICGNIMDRLELLPQTGIQCVSLDVKVELKQAKKILQGKMAVAGNVDPVSVLEDQMPEAVYQTALKCLDDGAPDGGFMLLPGCDISARVKEENLVAMVRAAHQWKQA
jgi:Uroporphyrinogen-III decarboxylase